MRFALVVAWLARSALPVETGNTRSLVCYWTEVQKWLRLVISELPRCTGGGNVDASRSRSDLTIFNDENARRH